jgi:hypothetical protein
LQKGGDKRLTSQDYKRLADRSAQLAIECAAPTVAEALMALALDYMKRAATASEQQQTAGGPSTARDPSEEFGD